MPIQANAGTASLPAYAFGPTASLNSDGMYSAGTNTLGFATNGTLRLSVSTAAVTSTLPFRGANGANTAPTYSFSGTTTMGMYASGTNTLGWSTNSVLRASLSTTAFNLLTDSFPLTIGASADLSLTHDGTNSIIRNDTGALNLQAGTTVVLAISAAGALSSAQAASWTGNHTFTPASGNTVVHAGNFRLDVDNLEVQIGAGQDLRLYHDGSNSIVRTDVGDLRFLLGATEHMRLTNASNTLTISRASGSVYMGAERASQGTGEVGLQILGGSGSANWFWYMPTSTDVLRLFSGADLAEFSTARFSFNRPLRTPGYTVAALPAGSAGDRAHVTDANAPVFGAAVAGGGAVTVPVYYTGAAWFVG